MGDKSKFFANKKRAILILVPVAVVVIILIIVIAVHASSNNSSNQALSILLSSPATSSADDTNTLKDVIPEVLDNSKVAQASTDNKGTYLFAISGTVIDSQLGLGGSTGIVQFKVNTNDKSVEVNAFKVVMGDQPADEGANTWNALVSIAEAGG